MEFGRRLLPQVVDHLAQTNPQKVYASFPKSPDSILDGFQDVTMAKLSSIVNHVSWWLEGLLGVGNLNTIAYIGPADIRYGVMFFAAVKCGYKMLLISPRNRVSQNQRMLEKSECKALFYAKEMATVKEGIDDGTLTLPMESVPSVNELLQTPESTKHYPYEKGFDEARDEPCLILHSSGSTGDPKLVTMTHGTLSCTDNDRNMPVPEGRKPQNASLWEFEGGGKFYSCFPPYHLGGVQAYICLPVISQATALFGPINLAPSGYLLSEIMKVQTARAFYVPPSIIEQWWVQPNSVEQAKHLDWVLFGGGPLSPQIGDRLSQITNLCQMYGSLEIGQVQLLVPQPSDWSYMELNPFEEADMQPMGDGTFEMVLHQDPTFATRRSLWHNFPHVKSWRTGDLFVPHPSKPGLWRFCARVDDLIVFSSGHKLRPIEMEVIIQGDPLLSGALITGQGRPCPILIVEPKSGAYDGNPEPFIDRLWPIVEEANKMAPTYATIHRTKVLVAQPEKPFFRAPKGTVVRKLTAQAYAEEIEAVYSGGNVRTGSNELNGNTNSIERFILPGLKQLVRKHLAELLPGRVIADNENVLLQGLDSLGCAGLCRALQKELREQVPTAKGSTISIRTIYQYPTIQGLAFVLVSALFNRPIPDLSIRNDVEVMSSALEELVKDLPAPPKDEVVKSTPITNGINVVLIGPRGSLGPNILRELMASQEVARIYCLNRGSDGREKMRATFRNRDFSCNIDDERLSFMSIELGKPNLGLSDAHYAELLRNAHVIVHNAWKVDFSWTLDTYNDNMRSVRDLVTLSSQSSLKPRIVFVSSIAAALDWSLVYQAPFTEKPLESYNVAARHGYGQSKHVAERVLTRASAVCGTPVTILRLGQIAGPTPGKGGKWVEDEWVPEVAAISKKLKRIPTTGIPTIDWLPVDKVASAVCELGLALESDDKPRSLIKGAKERELLEIFHVVNPKRTEWITFVNALQKRLGKEAEQVTMAEWVNHLTLADRKSMTEGDTRVPTKLLPFFQYIALAEAQGILIYPPVETSKAIGVSKILADISAIDETQVDFWLQQWNI